MTARRRLIIPEVVQTSGMDCGPASLKSLLEGFGRSVSYGRLREACQTDVDGTSIDTLEDIARQLGLEAEQVIVPVEHLLLEEAKVLPAIVVVRRPLGFAHFVVVWRTHAGAVVQVMDPGTGRRWPTCEEFLRELFVYETAIPVSAFRAYAASSDFLDALSVRLSRVGAGRDARELVARAIADPSWRAIAGLDASLRLVQTLVQSGGLRRGGESKRVLRDLLEQLQASSLTDDGVVPSSYWFARPAEASENGEEQVFIRGAVLVQVRGLADAAAVPDPTTERGQLSPELVAALEQPPSRPLRELVRMLREDGGITPAACAAAALAAAFGATLEAVLFRGLFDLGRHFGVTDKRMWAVAALVVFLGALVLLEVPLASALLRMGRRLEARFRIAFLQKIPRLGDRYFQSRPISDMAERSHEVHILRSFPSLGGALLRAVFVLVFTTSGIVWLDRASWPIACVVAVLSIAIPVVFMRSLTEKDLRVRSHVGALARYYLDALLGLVTIRAHGAQRAHRREHESLLVEWARASRDRDVLAIGTEAIQSVLGLGLTGWLFLSYFRRAPDPGAALLLLYWTYSLPAQGRKLAQALHAIPTQRNVALRLLEPLGAIEESGDGATHTVTTRSERSAQSARPPVGLKLESIAVRAGGHTILEDVSLEIAPGSHVAIVGLSGAGKSSLVGLLLGWHRAAKGVVTVDGELLTAATLDVLRKETAWVDPAVQIWNRSLLDNLLYGAEAGAEKRLGALIEQADLERLLQTLPDGLTTSLGEGGGLVSGGEGQRVRFGRSALRADARLVILDEPFRGLDRGRRRELLSRARRWWRGATLLCITHDVSETLDFERVVVLDGGRVSEDGAPSTLAADPDSRYSAMLAAEVDVRTGMWESAEWRRLHLRDGVLEERSAAHDSEREAVA